MSTWLRMFIVFCIGVVVGGILAGLANYLL